jgi:hypothetical protein
MKIVGVRVARVSDHSHCKGCGGPLLQRSQVLHAGLDSILRDISTSSFTLDAANQ